MKSSQLRRAVVIAGVLVGLSFPARAETLRDGSHDFDFARGVWHTHITRVLDPFDGGSHTVTMDGTKTARPVWGGRALLEEIEADGPDGHWQGATFFLYNPKSGQWSQTYIDSASGEMQRALRRQLQGRPRRAFRHGSLSGPRRPGAGGLVRNYGRCPPLRDLLLAGRRPHLGDRLQRLSDPAEVTPCLGRRWSAMGREPSTSTFGRPISGTSAHGANRRRPEASAMALTTLFGR